MQQRTSPEIATQAQLDEWLEFARSTRFASVVTVTADTSPAARPLTTQRVDAATGAFYFVDRRSDLAQQVRGCPKVAMVYTDHGAGKYLVFNGHASLRDDRALVRQLWSKMNEAFFPGGPDDPSLTLLHVDLTHAEMWEPQGSRPVQILRIAAVALGVDVDRDKLGRHTEAVIGRT